MFSAVSTPIARGTRCVRRAREARGARQLLLEQQVADVERVGHAGRCHLGEAHRLVQLAGPRELGAEDLHALHVEWQQVSDLDVLGQVLEQLQVVAVGG